MEQQRFLINVKTFCHTSRVSSLARNQKKPGKYVAKNYWFQKCHHRKAALPLAPICPSLNGSGL